MPQTLGLNHVAIHVANVAESIRFYAETMGFEQIPRPAFDFDGAWFRLGTQHELHIIGHRTEPVYAGSRANHFALEVENLHVWQEYLTEKRATFRPIKARPDGSLQIFVTDPDGHCIELCQLI